ncbi:DedA family protein, partial [Vibrio sp. 10N.222.49.C9]
VIGDPLCLAAGWLRMRFLPCLVLIALGKLVRYAVLVGLYTGLGNL